jgi:ankyrin repeat protein
MLLAHGASAAPLEAGGSGESALTVACEEGRTDVVAMLLAHGCGGIEQHELFGRTALHLACHRCGEGAACGGGGPARGRS